MENAVGIVRHSGLFDEAYYLDSYALRDPILTLVDPISHYLAVGFRKGYIPSPLIDIESYLNSNPDARISNMSPLLHFLLFGRAEGYKLQRLQARSVSDRGSRQKRATRIRRIGEFRSLAKRPRAQMPPVVDIIMPVYAGYRETLEAVYSVLAARNNSPFNFIVIDDCTPDRRLASILDKLAGLGLFTLMRNGRNRGFVRSVNVALRCNRSRDVILLNSDTQVFGDWIDRMLEHAVPGVATITPFSNNATLCSYPVIFADNKLQRDTGPKKLDAIAARCNRGMSVPVPTGVGFCLYMSRRAIEVVGMLDARTFGAGYGEENDFCRRAAAAGFINLHALDIFVYHKGGLSFGGTADARKAKNLAKLLRKYPDYSRIVREFAAADPSRAARRAIDFGRLTAKPHKRIILCFSHTLGGGIERYLLARSAAGRGKEVLIVARPEWSGNSISLEILGDVLDCPNLRGISCLEEDGELSELLASSRIDHVEVHSLFGYNSALVRLLPVLCRKLKLDYDFYLHDYLPLCPRINLVDSTNRYCGEAGQRQCCTCLRRKNPRLPPAHVDLLDSGSLAIRAWRSMYGDLLTRARAVVCPSKDASRRILRYLPGLRTILAPHEERDDATLVPVRQRKDRGRTLRIGVIGGLSVAKGAFVIADCARVALTSQDPVEFVVIGHSTELKTLNLPNVKMTGRYEDKRLRSVIRQNRLDCIFLPSVWPETYMYTLSHAFDSRLPVFVFDIGAQAERIASYPLGFSIPLHMIDRPLQILSLIRKKI